MEYLSPANRSRIHAVSPEDAKLKRMWNDTKNDTGQYLTYLTYPNLQNDLLKTDLLTI